MIRVVIADDHPMVRTGFAALLERSDDIAVVGTAGDGQEAVALARRLRPDVVLMDIRMPVLDGLGATTRIVADPDLGDVRIIVLTTFDADELVVDALRAGASGFLVKDVEPDELRRAIQVVADGDALLAPSVTRRLLDSFAAHLAVTDRDLLADLTEREVEVLAMVGSGLSNDQIAERFFLSPATVKTHVNRSMTKLGVHDRAGLVMIAYESGIVRPGHTSHP